MLMVKAKFIVLILWRFSIDSIAVLLLSSECLCAHSLLIRLAVLITFFMGGHNVQHNEHVNDDTHSMACVHVHGTYLDGQCVAYIIPMNCRMMNNSQTASWNSFHTQRLTTPTHAVQYRGNCLQ